jgi:PAS domain S-box-containing protein
MAGSDSTSVAAAIPVQMDLTVFIMIGILLLITTLMFFVFKSRFNSANNELKDLAGELSQTREHLTETSQQLEKTETDLKNTTSRYQGILFDAQVGMFQMDLDGTCTYINTAMQEISGLYPKKALKEGLHSALHPDDRKAFQEAWAAFSDGDEPFNLRCRFKHAKGREVHVVCNASKVLNERKDAESYIGWVSDVTPFHEEGLQLETRTARYAQFVDETIEGYFQLVPETPIPIAGSADQMAKAIMEKTTLASCNETFAAMYGTSPEELKGKSISALQGGCGPFKNAESVKKFVAAEYKVIGLESVRQDPRGNRLSLLNNVVGLIENKKLVGIWGSQRNISQQKREKAELDSQTQFMRRILNALPADVHVKDTRCRYLYASQKLAERTGIPQEEWIGKTIFEVMPATPRDHDKSGIEVMKNNKVTRTERPYETRGKSGWMETIQIPLVSNEGLVEGVVGLSLEISERKKKEEEARNQRQQLDQLLKTRTGELCKSQDEHGKAAIALRDTTQKLRIRDAEIENRENEFKGQLAERKRTEELLRRNEETLLTRQKQLEQHLSNRLDQLDQETDKRKKWEELIAIKEDALRSLEKLSAERQKQLEEEIALREQTQVNLATSQTGLEKYRQELELLATERDQETAALAEQHQKEFKTEHSGRQQAEGRLKQTSELLQKTQTRLKELAEQHATELEHEVSERKTATTKLIQSAEELDELKQKFNLRIETETKTLKHELAQRQIREKALRQHEKDLDVRIKELEKALQLKVKEHGEQIQAREGAEVERQKIEGKLEQLNSRQEALVERETQKLNLNIAEIRLQEVKLRKAVGDLQQTKEDLESLVEIRTAELVNAGKEQQKLTDALSDTQAQLEQVSKDQSVLVAKETETLQSELQQLKKTEHDLRKQEEQLKAQSESLEGTIQELSGKLNAETIQREETAKKLDDLQIAFDASQCNVESLIEQNTEGLTKQLEQHQRNEAALKGNETTLKTQMEALQQTIDVRTDELAEARKEREKAELELMQTIERSGQGAKEIEAKIVEIKQGHQGEIKRIKEEQKEVRQKEKYYRSLFQSSANAFLQIDPKSGKIRSANLAAANLFGEETTNILIDKTLDALSPKQQPDSTPSPDIAKARLHSTLETGHASFEWQFKKADDASFHGLVSLSAIDVEENQMILAVIQDISEIKRRQAELQQTIDEAHAANRMNSKLVDEVNETVQTSLDPVVESSATLEKSENLSGEQKLGVAIINRNCRSLIDIMNYRCELSHVADGSDEIESGKCDLHEIIKDLDEQFCQRAETKKLFFAVSYAQYQSANNVPKFVETDETKVRKTLEILLGYALAHTEKGRIGLHAARKSSEGDTITTAFELAYTGAAKKDEVLSRIFSGDAVTDDVEGMKYGLTLAQRYVHMLGGEVSLEYRQGDVTALTIDIPFKKVASEIVMPGTDDEKIVGAA